ncbi:hypothetical protein [Nonomuraea sp. bgisy101]|uniref:hypothetical protein n=1 Tax=Nonomuraea sp. bgisy101 TaxID=3413784 RepID=UPI003D72634F
MNVILLIALLLLMLAWPVPALAALALVVPAALGLSRRAGRTAVRDRTRALRAGWLLTAASACAAIAAYGYGLRTTTFGAWTDPDDRCGLARPDLYGYGHRGPDGGSHSMWPLHDTTCGPDLVPGFVNPVVAGSATLFAALMVIMTVATVAKARSRRRASQD